MQDRLPGSGLRPQLTPLRVWRIDAGYAAIVRILTAPKDGRVGGCLTHWGKRRSVACGGKDCLPALHRTGTFWRGYLAAEVYQQSEAHWAPICLEVTEHLELDFRGIIARGQVWEISLLKSDKRTHHPVTGTLLEERDPKTFPPAFDLLPCLLHLYHVDSLDLTIPNPLPPRTMVKPTQDAPPAAYKAPQPRPGEDPSPEAAEQRRATVRELMEQRRAAGGWVVPSASVNGAAANGQGNAHKR